MKAIVNPTALLKELRKMSLVIKKNHVIPITSAVKFEFTKGNLRITGTDLETTIITNCECEANEPFDLIIDYLKIVEVCSTCSAPLVIELKESEILVNSGKSKFKLALMGQAIEFPSIPDEEYVLSIEVDGDFFYHLNNANVCRSKDPLKPALNMAAIMVGKKELEVFGVDGFIMYTKALKQNSDKELTVMVCERFVALCKGYQSTTLSFGEKFAKAEYNGETVISRLNESKFVNIKSIIPKDISYNVCLPKDELKQALNAISVAANITSRQFVINFSEGKMTFVSQDIDFGNDAETVITCTHTVPIEAICLSSTQLLILIGLIDTDEIEMAFTSPTRSVMMRPKDDDTVLLLIQPLSVAA